MSSNPRHVTTCTAIGLCVALWLIARAEERSPVRPRQLSHEPLMALSWVSQIPDGSDNGHDTDRFSQGLPEPWSDELNPLVRPVSESKRIMKEVKEAYITSDLQPKPFMIAGLMWTPVTDNGTHSLLTPRNLSKPLVDGTVQVSGGGETKVCRGDQV